MRQNASPAYDATHLHIQWRRLVAYVDEATVTLLRSAFSRTVTDAWDFSCALFDRKGRMLAQPTQGLPAFIGCLCLSLADAAAAVPEGDWRDGDTWILNDPWRGTGQLNDLTLITPIFHRGKLVGFAANVSHSADLGGRVLSADATEIFEEGLRLPLMRAFIAGQQNEELFGILRMNSRVPDTVVGDLQAQLSANMLISRRATDFLIEQSMRDFDEFSDAVLDTAEHAIRAAVRQLPNGAYASEITTDGFDENLKIVTRVEILDEEIHVDYAGTSPQIARAINCCMNYTYSETVFPLICAAKPSGLINGGTLRPFTVVAPEGSILNPRPPASLGSRVLVSQYLQAAIFRALAPAMPDRVVGDCGTPAWLPILAGKNQHGHGFVEMLFLNGGFGARHDRDGISCLGWPASFSGTPIELTESEKPILIRTKELAPDSGGAGQFRGGLGQVFGWQSLSETPLTLAMRGDRVHNPPLGIGGGEPGSAGIVQVNGSAIHSKKTITINKGDIVELRTPGSGGYGPVALREPAAIAADVRNGYVTREAAVRLYGQDDRPKGAAGI